MFQKPYLDKYGALAFTTYAVWAGTAALVDLPAGSDLPQAGVAPTGTTLAMLYLGVFPTA